MTHIPTILELLDLHGTILVAVLGNTGAPAKSIVLPPHSEYLRFNVKPVDFYIICNKRSALTDANNFSTGVIEYGFTRTDLNIYPMYLTPADKWDPKLLEGEELETFYYGHFCADIPEENPAPVTNDNVNRPAHYTAGKIETIDFIEDKGFNYRIGNVIKYVSRHDKKYSDLEKQLEDLKKAAWYLEREIKARENALLSRGNG
jgi:hypothetical protein